MTEPQISVPSKSLLAVGKELWPWIQILTLVMGALVGVLTMWLNGTYITNAQFSKKMDSLEMHVSNVQGHMNNLDTSIDNTNQKLDKIDTKMNDILEDHYAQQISDHARR